MDATLFVIESLGLGTFILYLLAVMVGAPLSPRFVLGLVACFSLMFSGYLVTFAVPTYGWIVGYWYNGLSIVQAVLLIIDGFTHITNKNKLWDLD